VAEPGGTEINLIESESRFAEFMDEFGGRLRRALVAAYGVQIGNDVCADAVAWAWEHQSELLEMTHPVGNLYRVGQSSARRYHRWQREVRLPAEAERSGTAGGTGRLDEALADLSRPRRTVVVLVHAHGWSYMEVADALSISVASVRNHLHRGMRQLRKALEAS
jgi:RNA polymerase sigma factor (sigma-70 family)